jgi:hypothetical protein
MLPDDMIETIIATRDFMGDERAAAADCLSAAGLPVNPDTVSAALREADASWADYQRAAGVTRPVSSRERRQINRDLEG